MEIIKNYILISFILIFCSCSMLDPNSNERQLLDNLVKKNQKNDIKIFKPEMFDNLNYPIIEVRTNSDIIQLLMLPLATKNDNDYFFSGSGQSLILQKGIIVTTNGMNIDLLSLNTKPSFIHTNGNLETLNNIKLIKEYQFLNPLNGIDKYTFNCRINFIGKENINIMEKENIFNLLKEKCVFQGKKENLSFSNKYWLNDQNTIIKSIQWFSPKNIYIETLLLKE